MKLGSMSPNARKKIPNIKRPDPAIFRCCMDWFVILLWTPILEAFHFNCHKANGLRKCNSPKAIMRIPNEQNIT